MISLVIRVTDLNQLPNYINSSEAVITIRINDLNDNPPEFFEDTLYTSRSVLEAANANAQIGSIYAIDRDGPLHNKITYKIV